MIIQGRRSESHFFSIHNSIISPMIITFNDQFSNSMISITQFNVQCIHNICTLAAHQSTDFSPRYVCTKCSYYMKYIAKQETTTHTILGRVVLPPGDTIRSPCRRPARRRCPTPRWYRLVGVSLCRGSQLFSVVAYNLESKKAKGLSRG